MEVPVFRNGAWVYYPKPMPMNPLWSQEHILKAASFYATALSQGYPPSESAVFAEAYVNKMVFPGIGYMISLERTLKSIMDHVETA